LADHGVEAYVIHPASIAVSREHRRATTDRLDTELLLRAFLGWLRGEKRRLKVGAAPGHVICSVAVVVVADHRSNQAARAWLTRGTVHRRARRGNP
jgi:hypothetical protein